MLQGIIQLHHSARFLGFDRRLADAGAAVDDHHAKYIPTTALRMADAN
jgi:hypothetical protein